MTYKMYIYKYLQQVVFVSWTHDAFSYLLILALKNTVFISICHKAGMADHLNF